MDNEIKCPVCKIHQDHFNEEDFLICTNCGISFHKRGKDFVLKDEKSVYGRIYGKNGHSEDKPD